ncbi:MAG: hypothetical protein ABR921_07355 [Candidatus Sulfotelmatobacter sp.]|jgi:hypothetical protein
MLLLLAGCFGDSVSRSPKPEARSPRAGSRTYDSHPTRLQIENAQSENRKIGSGKLGGVARRPSRTNGFLQKPAASLAKNEALIIAAEGYTPGSPTAQTIAAERHLLETVLGRPVMVREMKSMQPARLKV